VICCQKLRSGEIVTIIILLYYYTIILYSNTRHTRLHQHPRHTTVQNGHQSKNTHHYQERKPEKHHNMAKSYFKPARTHGKITYHGVTHLATWHKNSRLETNGIHDKTKTKNVCSIKIKLRQVQPLHTIVNSTKATTSIVTRNLSPLSTS
jgi:hypothetical protein